MTSNVDSLIRPGDVLAGKYRVERVLGAGGMGVVVAAHHLQLDERVALKFLLPGALQSADALARFEREARAAVKIKSEHVARIIDIGRLESGAPYMVMEYLEGSDLSAWLEEHGALSFEQAADFVIQACDALVEAHVLGIVHRDLKPANLFCVRGSDGLPLLKVLDFGISKSTGGIAPGHDLTQTAALLGSPLYMSPEQMRSSKSVDARTDIWALGVVLFQLVTGRVPFEAETLPELVLQVVDKPAPSVLTLRPDAPPALDHVIACCLQRDRAHRYANVGELVLALAPIAPDRSRPIVERVLRVLHAKNPSGRPAEDLAIQRATPPPPTPLPPRERPVSQPVGLSTGSAWGKTTTGQSRLSSGRLAVAAGAGVFGLLVLVVGGFGVAKLAKTLGSAPVSSAPVGEASSTSANAIPMAAPSAIASSMGSSRAPATPAPDGLSTPSADAAPAASGIAPLPPALPAKPAPPATTTANPTSRTPAPPPPSSKPGANCNPPYYIDERGRRVFKKECV